jgi:hypothetical protein
MQNISLNGGKTQHRDANMESRRQRKEGRATHDASARSDKRSVTDARKFSPRMEKRQVNGVTHATVDGLQTFPPQKGGFQSK